MAKGLRDPELARLTADLGLRFIPEPPEWESRLRSGVGDEVYAELLERRATYTGSPASEWSDGFCRFVGAHPKLNG